MSVISSEVLDKLPSVAYLRECFDLDVETGVLTWRRRPRAHFIDNRGYNTWIARYAGKQAGVVNTNGYLRVGICDIRHSVSRVVFAMHHGIEMRDLPEIVDHINGCRTDNRPANLRPATSTQNAHNARTACTNRSGYRGVLRNKRSGRWNARIEVGGVIRHLGTFETAEAASAAYEAAAAALHGEFYKPEANALLAGAA